MSTLRPLPDVPAAAGAAIPPVELELAFVDVNALFVDGSYQRDVDARGRKHIARIAAYFDWRKFAPLMVAPAPGGRFAVIDGQHRAAAAKARGIESLPALIVPIARQAQAASFAAVNGDVRRMTACQVYKAALAAGDEWARSIDRACARARVTALSYPVRASVMNLNETLAHGTLGQLLQRHGEDALGLGLACVAGSRNNGPGLINADRLRLTVPLIAERKDWQSDRASLIDAFARVSLWNFTRHMRGALEAEIDRARANGARPAPKRPQSLVDEVKPAARAARRTELAKGKGSAGEWW